MAVIHFYKRTTAADTRKRIPAAPLKGQGMIQHIHGDGKNRFAPFGAILFKNA